MTFLTPIPVPTLKRHKRRSRNFTLKSYFYQVQWMQNKSRSNSPRYASHKVFVTNKTSYWWALWRWRPLWNGLTFTHGMIKRYQGDLRFSDGRNENRKCEKPRACYGISSSTTCVGHFEMVVFSSPPRKTRPSSPQLVFATGAALFLRGMPWGGIPCLKTGRFLFFTRDALRGHTVSKN